MKANKEINPLETEEESSIAMFGWIAILAVVPMSCFLLLFYYLLAEVSWAVRASVSGGAALVLCNVIIVVFFIRVR